MTGKTQDAINAKKAAINGHADQTGCHAWVDLFANLRQPGNYLPTSIASDVTGQTQQGTTPGNNCLLPASMIYDAQTNPTGVRCTGADHAASVFGTTTITIKDTDNKDTSITYARTTVDNVGVQYGLQALLSGAITGDEFVALNEKIGGVDFDDHFIASLTGTNAFARTQADPDALATAYRAGIVSDGAHLARLPIIDLRGWDDMRKDLPFPPPFNRSFGIHHEWRSFALRARLDAASGGHANHVMWRFEPNLIATPDLTLQSFLMIDQWVGGMQADTSTMTVADKMAAHRPTGAVDFCTLLVNTAGGPTVARLNDMGLCETKDPVLKPHSSPRQVAGGPLAENVLKCQLRPIHRTDYSPIELTDDQFNRLKAVFPDGVCDFSKPGVAQQPAVGPLDFSAGPGGVPLARPPQQQPF